MGMNASVFLGLVDQVLVKVGRLPLNNANRQIVQVSDHDRVLQILAGPGSGKTEMLVWRVLYELFVIGTPANRVMVTTFTQKAATELSVRLVERADLLVQLARAQQIPAHDPRVHDLRLGTIHSLCESLLAEFLDSYMASGTQLIDETETLIRMVRVQAFRFKGVLQSLLNTEALVALFRAPWDESDRWPSNGVQRMRFVAALLGQHTETWEPRCAANGTLNGIEIVHHTTGLTDQLQDLRSRWTAYLDEQGILDFTTLQTRFYQHQAAVLGHIDHVFVDEFQDTNPIQFSIHTYWLQSNNTRLTVVGDDDQAMYRFRGSDFECFKELGPYCQSRNIAFRLEKLEENWRSTQAIVDFSQQFKRASVLNKVSMPKHVRPAPDATMGVPVRLLQGPWEDLCHVVTAEIGNRTPHGAHPNTGCLFFSTSEKGTKSRTAPARSLRDTIEDAGLQVYNARNKTAARDGSPVAELLGLLSYLIDPITKAPAGANGRLVEVWATAQGKKQFALSQPPDFPINNCHADFQKKFIKADGGSVGAPTGDRQQLLDYIDDIRTGLINANDDPTKPVRLTITGLVSRILSFPRYRNSGYTAALFRQALFTNLLESNIAPTRRTQQPLDSPLDVQVNSDGKYVWDKRYWSFLNVFGSFLSESDLDDPEVEVFEHNAVMLLTYHQSKGLEFDHVYVSGMGRVAAPHSVLQTLLFSGKTPQYCIAENQPESPDQHVRELAEADRDRELYVAMTRAKQTLTFLYDPSDEHPLMRMNPALALALKERMVHSQHPDFPSVTISEFNHA